MHDDRIAPGERLKDVEQARVIEAILLEGRVQLHPGHVTGAEGCKVFRDAATRVHRAEGDEARPVELADEGVGPFEVLRLRGDREADGVVDAARVLRGIQTRDGPVPLKRHLGDRALKCARRDLVGPHMIVHVDDHSFANSPPSMV